MNTSLGIRLAQNMCLHTHYLLDLFKKLAAILNDLLGEFKAIVAHLKRTQNTMRDLKAEPIHQRIKLSDD